MNIRWNAEQYETQFSFVAQYGIEVLSLLDLQPDKIVLDLGCGNGVLTQKLSEMGVTAIGLDADAEQLRLAKTHYPHLIFLQADATKFQLPKPVDAVFSNAVLHWIDAEQQPDLLHCVYKALKVGGQFVFEFGGFGNCQKIHTALADVFQEWGMHYALPNYFPTIGEYATLLEQAGFRVTDMRLFDRLTPLKGTNGVADWIRMFVRKPFSGMLEEQKEQMIQQAAERTKKSLYQNGIWYADYVRIRGKATK